MKKQVALWALYDFANSMAAAVFGIYFAQWLVVERQVSDLKFNLIFVTSSFFLLLTAPFFGIIVDKVRVKMPSLRMVTFYSFLSLISVAALAQLADPSPRVVNAVIALLAAGQYFYQLSNVFYNPLLKELGNEAQQARFSGYGAAAGGLGQIVGLLITLPLATGSIYLFGHNDISQVFTPTAVLFLLLTLPVLLFFKERSRPPEKISLDLKAELRGLIDRFIQLKKYPGVQRFLLGYFLFNDAILTAGHNLPIYIQQVFQIDEGTKTVILGSILLAGAVGAFSSGWIASKIGDKRLLLILLLIWIIMLPLTALQSNLTLFGVCLVIIGLLLGATLAIARAVITYLTPPQELAHVFGYYVMTERLASFLGPLAWGLVTFSFLSYGSVRYQLALAFMTVFLVIGFLIVRKVPSEQEVAARG